VSVSPHVVVAPVVPSLAVDPSLEAAVVPSLDSAVVPPLDSAVVPSVDVPLLLDGPLEVEAASVDPPDPSALAPDVPLDPSSPHATIIAITKKLQIKRMTDRTPTPRAAAILAVSTIPARPASTPRSRACRCVSAHRIHLRVVGVLRGERLELLGASPIGIGVTGGLGFGELSHRVLPRDAGA
jgi:hypothetical protein